MQPDQFYAIAIAFLPMIGVAFSLSHMFASFVNSVSKNPVSKDQVFTPLILGMAAIELLGLMTFGIAFLMLNK